MKQLAGGFRKVQLHPAKEMGRLQLDILRMQLVCFEIKQKHPKPGEQIEFSCPAEAQRGRGGHRELTLLWVNSLNMAARLSSSTSLSVLMATLRMWMGSSRALCRDKGTLPMVK